jgi:hypothetical protein
MEKGCTKIWVSFVIFKTLPKENYRRFQNYFFNKNYFINNAFNIQRTSGANCTREHRQRCKNKHEKRTAQCISLSKIQYIHKYTL